MKKKIFNILLLSVMLSACTVEEQFFVDEIAVAEKSQEVVYVNVEFSDDMLPNLEKSGTKALGSDLDELGVVSLERVFPDAGEWEERHREAGLHRWYRLAYKSEVKATKAVETILELPYSVHAEVEPEIELCASGIPFNDPYRNQQWHLYNDGSLYSGFRAGADINVVPLWNLGITGSSDVIVNVVDTGVNYMHEELSGVVLEPGAGGSKSFVTGYTGYNMTGERHGTHVSGIIGAINNNGKGVCGIAGGSDGEGGVNIINSQIFMTDPSDASKTLQGNTASAIIWGADNGAVISQNSWNYTYNSEADAKKGSINLLLKAAVDYFISNAGVDNRGVQTGPMKGGVVFFSAGNNNYAYGHPASYEKIIAVGAVGPNGKKASYSNYGDWVDICAPGGNYSAFPVNQGMIYSTASTGYTTGGYAYMQGTSMACPVVSGVAALLVSCFGGPGFTNEDLKEMLINGANRNFGVSEKIGPLVDAFGSYEYFKTPEVPVISTTYTGDYVVQAHKTLRVVYTVENMVSRGTITVEADKSASYNIKDGQVVVNYNFGATSYPGKHHLTITAKNNDDCYAVHEVDYEILPNHEPECKVISFDKYIGAVGSDFSIPVNMIFEDEDGETLSYSCSVDGGSCSASVSSGNLVLKGLKEGVSTVTVKASDKAKTYAELTFRASVLNSPAVPLVYPLEFANSFSILSKDLGQMTVTVYDGAGEQVLTTLVRPGIFDPAPVNMSDFAPGQYTVSIKYGNTELRRKVTKTESPA